MQSLKCPSCNAPIPTPSAKFCSFCGVTLVPSASVPQPLPTSATLLKMGKDLVTAGNFKEADQQFTIALQFEPDNKEAWLWKGVCALYGIGAGNYSAHFEKSGFTRDEILRNLASIVRGSNLLYMFNQVRTNDPLSSTLFEAAFQAQNDQPSRQTLIWFLAKQIENLGNDLSTLKYVLDQKTPSYTIENYREMILSSDARARAYLDKLGSDQPNDIVEAEIEQVGFLTGGSKHLVREKPSYWRKYIQQVEAQLPRPATTSQGSVAASNSQSGTAMPNKSSATTLLVAIILVVCVVLAMCGFVTFVLANAGHVLPLITK
jgi:hypothetical protein